MTDIDRTAPVQAEAASTANAPADRVFEVLAAIADWGTVYPELREMEADGPAALGSTFRFRSGPMAIEGTVTALEAGRLLAFEGRGKGASSSYVFRLTAEGDGTRIEAAQSMSGLAVKTMKPMLQKIASTSLQDWADAIAAASEQA